MKQTRKKMQTQPNQAQNHYDKYGYEYVILTNSQGEKVKKYVHMMVAESFVPNPNEFKFVIHKDGDVSNNHADNLQWVDEYDYTEWLINHFDNDDTPF